MNPSRLRAGIDVGGTKTAVGTVLENGQLTAFEAFPTPQEPDVAIRRIGETLAALLHRQGKTIEELAAVGLAFPGDLDPATGKVITSPNLLAFVGLAPRELMCRELRQRFGREIPVKADNDTCAAVLAEARFGAGRGFERLFYLTVSTGVGGARYDGTTPTNIEPGMHTYPDPHRPGVRLGDLASGAALAHRARRRLIEAQGSGQALAEVSRILELDDLAHLPVQEALVQLSARHVAEAAAAGDRFSEELVADSARQTAATLRQLLLQGFGEERIIVGGSVALKTKGYLDLLRRELAQALSKNGDTLSFTPATDLVQASLGDDRGVIGAALF